MFSGQSSVRIVLQLGRCQGSLRRRIRPALQAVRITALAARSALASSRIWTFVGFSCAAVEAIALFRTTDCPKRSVFLTRQARAVLYVRHLAFTKLTLTHVVPRRSVPGLLDPCACTPRSRVRRPPDSTLPTSRNFSSYKRPLSPKFSTWRCCKSVHSFTVYSSPFGMKATPSNVISPCVSVLAVHSRRLAICISSASWAYSAQVSSTRTRTRTSATTPLLGMRCKARVSTSAIRKQ